jgi:hypothetical protein
MPLDPHLVEFVQAAVRLPSARLRRIDRQWDKLGTDRRVVAQLVRESTAEVRHQVEQLREYILTAARMAGATGDIETGTRALLPEEVTEAVLPAARAVLLRKQLENSPAPDRRAAFAALTAPFIDVLPPSEGAGRQP